MSDLTKIQNELKVPKGQFNKFGNYKYRSCEDILEAVKPLLLQYDCSLFVSDEIQMIGDRHYVCAKATFKSKDETIEITAYAREEKEKKGMDGSQITGSASSYARKYALNGLFAIDDTKDSDFTNTHDKDVTTDKKAFVKPETKVEFINDVQVEKLKTAMMANDVKKDYADKFFKMINCTPKTIKTTDYVKIMNLVISGKLFEAVDNGDLTWLK